MELREVDNVEEASKLLSQGWVLRSTHTVSKIVYVLEKPSSPVQEKSEQEKKEAEESRTLKEILEIPSQPQPQGQSPTASYDILPWKEYPSGKGFWVFSDPAKYPNLSEEARKALETLRRELESNKSLEDSAYVYMFSTDPTFIKRVPKEKKA